MMGARHEVQREDALSDELNSAVQTRTRQIPNDFLVEFKSHENNQLVCFVLLLYVHTCMNGKMKIPPPGVLRKEGHHLHCTYS